MRFVVLHMVDAWSDMRKLNIEGLRRLRSAKQIAAGMLADVDGERYVLVGDAWEWVDGEPLYDLVQVIPVEMVKRVEYLTSTDDGSRL